MSPQVALDVELAAAVERLTRKADPGFGVSTICDRADLKLVLEALRLHEFAPGSRATDNARLLAGYIMGRVTVDDGGLLGYEYVEHDAATATTVLRTKHSGNTFRVSVEQIGGVE